ncbi:MAG: methyl-accepting chemotaxis protein [Armatimonadetes bacterium]|nr:methyl-accepting chemotaxis protein [Armatimonadota bacterium]
MRTPLWSPDNYNIMGSSTRTTFNPAGFLGNLSLGQKLIGAIVSVILVGSIGTLGLSRAIDRTENQMSDVILPSIEIYQLASQARSYNQDMGSNMYLFALTGDPKIAEAKEKADEDFIETMKVVMGKIEKLPNNSKLLEAADKVGKADEELCAPNETKAMDAFEKGDKATALKVISGDYAAGRKEFESVFSAFQQEISTYYTQAKDISVQEAHNGKIFGLIAAVVSVIFGLVIASAFSRVVKNTIAGMSLQLGKVLEENLTALTNGVNALGQGDLSHKISISEHDEVVRRKDEFGVLSEMMGRFIRDTESALEALQSCQSTLRNVVAGVRQQSDLVAVSSETLSDTTKSAFESAGAIAQSTQDVLHATNELAQTSTRLAEVSEKTASEVNSASAAMSTLENTVAGLVAMSDEQIQLVEEATHRAKIGGESVESAINSLENIATQVHASADVIRDLGEQQVKIGEIVSMIEDISGQTNLLALNAAIEAARAGEHGRGFAVVADEVRKLAERAGQAAGEISDLIGSVRANVSKATEEMEGTTREVEKGTEQSAAAKTALTAIVQSVGDVHESASGFKRSLESTIGQTSIVKNALLVSSEVSSEGAANSQQLSAVSEEICASAQVVTGYLDSQKSEFLNIESASQNLADQAKVLRESVSVFQLSTDEETPKLRAA